MTATSALRVRSCAVDPSHMNNRSSPRSRERSWHREGARSLARQGGVPVEGGVPFLARNPSVGLLIFSLLALSLSAHAQSINQYAQNRTGLNEQIFYQAFKFLNTTKIQTGTIYNATLPTSITDNSIELVTIQVVRLRRGSLKRRGISFNEINLPVGLRVAEPLRYVALVYRKFNKYGYYDATNGTVFVAPVVGIIGYNYDIEIESYATNYGQELSFDITGGTPIQVRLQSTRDIAQDQENCIFYTNNVNGTAAGVVDNVTSSGLCSWNTLGDYSLLGPPLHLNLKSNTWKIVVGSVVGGLAAIVLLVLAIILAAWYRERARFADMEHKSDQGETLHHTWFGTSRAPSAAGTRTKPILENENA